MGTSLAPADQLRIRYDAAAKRYEVKVPSSGTWEGLTPFGTNNFQSTSVAQFNVVEGAATGYDYSALAQVLREGDMLGGLAFGIPTAAGGVPMTGSASYAGSLMGQTTETYFDGLFQQTVDGWVYGTIDLNFNFGAGTLSGSIDPTLYLGTIYHLTPLQFTKTVYSAGSTSFSGEFDSPLTGQNNFSGVFTGPAAQELIGNFAFPYKSPIDNNNYEATGAFVAKQ
jgi:hypothetical protein